MYKVEIMDTEGRLKNAVLRKIAINLYKTKIKENTYRKKYTFARKINVIDKPRVISIKYKPRYKKIKGIKNNIDNLEEYINLYENNVLIYGSTDYIDDSIDISNQIMFGN